MPQSLRSHYDFLKNNSRFQERGAALSLSCRRYNQSPRLILNPLDRFPNLQKITQGHQSTLALKRAGSSIMQLDQHSQKSLEIEKLVYANRMQIDLLEQLKRNRIQREKDEQAEIVRTHIRENHDIFKKLSDEALRIIAEECDF